MKPETKALMEAAEIARGKLRMGLITYDEARKIVGNYAAVYNARAKELAKENGVSFKAFSITAYLR